MRKRGGTHEGGSGWQAARSWAGRGRRVGVWRAAAFAGAAPAVTMVVPRLAVLIHAGCNLLEEAGRTLAARQVCCHILP